MSHPHASITPDPTATSALEKRAESTVLAAVPAHGLVLLAIIAIQFGAAIATHLFPILGPEGTVAIRILFSAILMGLAARGRSKTFAQTFIANWRLLLAFGFCIASMNLFFYQAIARIPLGAAVAIEFAGPLGVATFASRRIGQFAWVALAALGIILLSPLSGADLDVIGILFALLAGAGWAFFILMATKVGKQVPEGDGLAIGMIVAAIAMLPVAVPALPALVTDPMVLVAALGVAVLSTAIPFTLEFEALKRLSTRNYGVLVSLEPAVATTAGALLLGERIGLQGIVAVFCVVAAAAGITISDARADARRMEAS